MSARPVLGLDVGGTSTRALAVDIEAGERLGTGRAGGANPIAHGMARAAENIGAALRDALAGRDPADVQACVVGLAGASKLAADPSAAATFAQLWDSVGLRCEVSVISDVAAAFAAGTPEPCGSVLIAGTGAVAVAMVARRPCRWRDGHGWLLGDEGSGFWIGREAVRAILAELDDTGPAGCLREVVMAEYLEVQRGHVDVSARQTEDAESGAARLLVSELIAAVNERPPPDLAALVPGVVACAAAGDRVAGRILTEASGHLVAALHQVREVTENSPIVLAGGVLAPESPVGGQVRAALATAWPDAPVSAGTDGAAGAAWLAALPLLGGAGEASDPGGGAEAHDPGDGVAARALHARLMAEGGTGDASTRRG